MRTDINEVGIQGCTFPIKRLLGPQKKEKKKEKEFGKIKRKKNEFVIFVRRPGTRVWPKPVLSKTQKYFPVVILWNWQHS